MNSIGNVHSRDNQFCFEQCAEVRCKQDCSVSRLPKDPGDRSGPGCDADSSDIKRIKEGGVKCAMTPCVSTCQSDIRSLLRLTYAPNS